MPATTLPLSPLYDRAVRVALYQQIPTALLALCVLDGGRVARLCAIAMIAFWTAAALMLLRRPRTPAPTDTAFLRYAFLPLFAAVITATSALPD